MPRGRSKATLELIEACQEILETEAPTTVRGVCYRLFVQGLIDNMGKASTNRISRILTDARERGEIDWADIVDETRAVEQIATWASPDEIIDSAVRGYRRDYWAEQDDWIEVWSEKGTVRGILKPVLDKYGIAFRVMHGYPSATVINAVAEETRAANKPLTVLYVGDWDPSGLHMSAVDVPKRLSEYGAEWFDIHRVALDAADVYSEQLPSFSAEDKKKDPRHRWFRDRYGDRCWELDALPSSILRDRIEKWIRKFIDMDKWDHALKIEKQEVGSMHEFHRKWREAQQSKLGQASEYPEAQR
jgi:hypothetical protein